MAEKVEEERDIGCGDKKLKENELKDEARQIEDPPQMQGAKCGSNIPGSIIGLSWRGGEKAPCKADKDFNAVTENDTVYYQLQRNEIYA